MSTTRSPSSPAGSAAVPGPDSRQLVHLPGAGRLLRPALSSARPALSGGRWAPSRVRSASLRRCFHSVGSGVDNAGAPCGLPVLVIRRPPAGCRATQPVDRPPTAWHRLRPGKTREIHSVHRPYEGDDRDLLRRENRPKTVAGDCGRSSCHPGAANDRPLQQDVWHIPCTQPGSRPGAGTRRGGSS